MRTGIFGGTFDPPHNGHVSALEAFIREVKPDRVLVFPTGTPPHKPDGKASDTDRLEMAKLAFSCFPNTEVCDYEVEKGGKSYSVETLEWLKDRYPEDEFIFYTGSDMFLSFHRWYRAERIMSLCSVAAFSRTGSDREALDAQAEFLREKYGASVCVYDFTPQVVSSTDIRSAVENGDDISDKVPEKVREYIEEHGLYGYDLLEYKKLLKQRVNEKRYLHSLGVSKTAKHLAEKYGADPKKAEIAGILHDITKNLNGEEQIRYCAKHGIALEQDDIDSPQTIHAITAAYYAENRLGITDSEILSAIRYHTTGREDMSLLDKIVYVSDFIEPTRNYSDVDYYRALAEKDLDDALFEGMEWIIADKLESSGRLHGNTIKMHEWYLRNGYGEYNKNKKGQTAMIEQMVKKAVNALDSKHAVDIKVIKIDEITTLTSYFVICNGTSTTQVRTLADECEYQMEQAGYKIGHREGKPEGGWILLDYYDVIIHVYTKEARKFYDLERFWKDGIEMDLNNYLEKKEED